MNITSIARAVADFVVRDQNGFAEAIICSYPPKVVPYLVLLVNNELDKEHQAKFMTFMTQLYEDY
jgi:hypothetical protein